MVKRIAIISALILASVGCASTVDDTEKVEGGVSGINVIHVDVDGRRVPCIHSWGTKSRAISCDWDYNTREER